MTKLIFLTPPTREADFWLARIGVVEKNMSLALGWQRQSAPKSRARENNEIVRGLPFEIRSAH